MSVLFTAHFLISCTEQKSQQLQRAIKDSTESQTFFPVTEYINGQLSEVESLPVTPLKIVTQNGKSDSTWMKKENIREFAKPFLYPEIDTANFKDLFVQKSFLDQTINAFTLSYDPIDKLPDTLQLRRWDVYIDPKKIQLKEFISLKRLIIKGFSKFCSSHGNPTNGVK
ncbi:MAG: hypothetical protein WKF59_07895 [Chitinophagaceae bacterium]